jgi:hypothetical protein
MKCEQTLRARPSEKAAFYLPIQTLSDGLMLANLDAAAKLK